MKNLSLENKRVVLFYPDFFGYGNKIANAMREMKVNVSLHNSRPVKSAFARAIFKIFPELVLKYSKSYYTNILNAHKDENLDYIVVVERLPIWFLKEMKKSHPSAKLILYMDDSIKNLKCIEKRFPYFDRILSFDKNDVDKHDNIIFRPLFYTEKKVEKKTNYKYDLCFIGTCHSDRYSIVKAVEKQCDKGKFYYYLYLQSPFMYLYYKVTNKGYRAAKRSDFKYEKLDYKENIEIEDSSKVILDIQHPAQSGLTMRTIEMVGLKKKTITTNKDICNYDFYRPENIMVIDRDNPIINKEFFDIPYTELPDDIYYKYDIRQWIVDVLGV